MEADDTDCSHVALGDLSPWFWLHDIANLTGSTRLEGAAGPLYMGGNLEEATEYLIQQRIDPKNHFKFFRKYKQWPVGQLEHEVQMGKWTATAQDPQKALRHVVLPSFKL